MNFPDASRFAGNHDLVLVGYRGVDGSSKLGCPEVTSAREHARDFLSEESFRADAAAFKACAHRLQQDGVDLAGYTLPERVDDLDAARQALGYQRIDLLSESAGTRTALIYAWRYPAHTLRSVLIDVNPPGGYLWDAQTTGQQIRRYAALCAQDSSCRSRTPDLAASIHSAYEHIPGRFWFLPVKKGAAATTAFWGLMQATSAAEPISAPMTIDTLLSAGHGDGSGSWFLALMGSWPSRPHRSGVMSPRSAGPTLPTPSASSRPTPTAGQPSAPPARISSGPAASSSVPGPRAPTRTSTRTCPTRRSRLF